jgi:hypothetical protein
VLGEKENVDENNLKFFACFYSLPMRPRPDNYHDDTLEQVKEKK